MSRISGTVSRSIPLDPVIGRPFSLSGTFDLFVTQAELQAISPTLDSLIASGILTKHQRYTESDSLIAAAVAPVTDATGAGTSQAATIAPLQVIPLTIPDAAGDNTYAFSIPKKVQIVDAWVIAQGGGAGNTVKLQNSAVADISNAFSAASDKVPTHAGTLDPTKTTISDGVVNVLAHRAAGTMLCEIFLAVILR